MNKAWSKSNWESLNRWHTWESWKPLTEIQGSVTQAATKDCMKEELKIFNLRVIMKWPRVRSLSEAQRTMFRTYFLFCWLQVHTINVRNIIKVTKTPVYLHCFLIKYTGNPYFILDKLKSKNKEKTNIIPPPRDISPLIISCCI